MNLFSIIYCFFFLCSCERNSDQIVNENTDQIENDSISTQNTAIAVYNQAYQENYEADAIVDILVNAKNSYVLVDPFGENLVESIAALKANGNEVGAYISIGTGETYRDDYEQLKPFLVSKAWGEWPDEFFVNQTTTGILEIMKARIDKIAAWGCDWVEFDNMDWAYDEDNRGIYGFQVTEAEAISYFQVLCDYVHEKGMKCMAKNMTEEATAFDGVLYESYNNDKNWWDQSGAQNFLDAGKLVIINHYNETNCGQVYSDYKGIYNSNLSFICEDANLKKYVHFND
ncbi:endo alpha-1,4 polygalactosaminidase [Maribacter sp. 2308TA10-17]|uniref:endo alpha-1,4 polygalactosaminidase n=1 Tax=Maribacter sp. 2308TA10-17 TaxID=3386276 RepID=UPI0039BD86C6